MPNIQ